MGLRPFALKKGVSIPAELGLSPPPFSRSDPFSQLNYIGRYAERLGAQTVVVENEYIDRDFIEDFSLFYARSLSITKSSCRRIHFLRTPFLATGGALGKIEPDDYLGFTVVRPLPGAPVGRTVLRPYKDEENGFRRFFPANECETRVHLAGQELVVPGLAFQQQDTGVSACATTALWSALHIYRQHEAIGRPTPAQISAMAVGSDRNWVPMLTSNEDGLSIEEMRRALRGVGMTSALLETSTAEQALSSVNSSLRSGFAPLLIMKHRESWHAVTVSGISHATRQVVPDRYDMVETDLNIRALYLHDDRIGPYMKATIKAAQKLVLRPAGRKEEWTVRFVMVPLPQKIRLAPSSLRDIALQMTVKFQEEFGFGLSWSYRFERSNSYFKGHTALTAQLSSSPPRYVGIVSMHSQGNALDLLVDPTSTMKNLAVLGLVARTEGSREMSTKLASRLLIKDLSFKI